MAKNYVEKSFLDYPIFCQNKYYSLNYYLVQLSMNTLTFNWKQKWSQEASGPQWKQPQHLGGLGYSGLATLLLAKIRSVKVI